MVELKKVKAGAYEILKDGAYIGCVVKKIYSIHSSKWTAMSAEHGIETDEQLTRKAAVEKFMETFEKEVKGIEKRKAAAIVAEREKAPSYAAIMRKEIREAIDSKIQKIPSSEFNHTSIWIGVDLFDLRGSEKLGFIEFMHLDSYGTVYDHMSYDRHCEMITMDDKECTAEMHDENFVDCWNDYIRSWKKANEDLLCSSCFGLGSHKVDHSGSVLKYATCSHCGGSCLEPKGKEKNAEDAEYNHHPLVRLNLQHFASDVYGSAGLYIYSSDGICKSFNSAMYILKESGECKVDKDVAALVTFELDEMGIKYSSVEYDNYIEIMQLDPDE